MQDFQLVVFPASNGLPVAVANGPYSVTDGSPVQFSSAGSTDPDGDPLSFAWNFGDGNTTNTPNPQHTYDLPGDYIVTLFVSDGRGGVASDRTRATVIQPNRAPTAFVEQNPTNDLRLGESVTLDGAGSFDLDGDVLTFAWDFGDGTLTNDETVIHTYATTGTFVGVLVVDDSRGGSDTNTFTVDVGPPNQPPVSSFSVTQFGPNIGDFVQFDAGASFDPEGDPLRFDWDFGDQAVSMGEQTFHAFEAGGDFNVVLTVTDSHLAESIVTNLVHVNLPPIFVSTPPADVNEDTLFTYLPVVTDPDGVANNFEIIEAPAGMTLTPGTGALNWTPDNDDVGQHVVILAVRDNLNASAEQHFVLDVINVNDPPVILSTPPTNAGVNAAYIYQVYARDDDRDPLSFSLVQSPAGMSIQSGGLISWMPNAGHRPDRYRRRSPRRWWA
ncbi:MAG: PKD domain-containing protein, partial [Verrucomicrobiota bacterium]